MISASDEWYKDKETEQLFMGGVREAFWGNDNLSWVLNGNNKPPLWRFERVNFQAGSKGTAWKDSQAHVVSREDLGGGEDVGGEVGRDSTS